MLERHVRRRNAAAGLNRLGDGAVDCIVSDYQMPEMDGLAFLSAVREDHPDLPFILFTGRGSEEVAGDAIGAVTDGAAGGARFEIRGVEFVERDVADP